METKKIVSLDIISSCVCRDCFEIGRRSTKKNQYSIELFFQGTSIFSLYTKPHPELQKIKAEDLVFGSPWQRRLLINEIKRNAFERVGEKREGNFLILDFTDFAKDLYKLVGKEDMYLLQTEPSKNNISLFSDYVEGIVSPWTLPREKIDNCLDFYVDDILKRYDAEKIILCKIFHVKDYISSINTIRVFKAPIDTYNSFIEYCYNYFVEAVSKTRKSIHIIEMPDNTIGDEGQKWGLYSLHYHKEFYEYLLSAIDIVFCKYDREEELAILNDLKEDFESRLELVRQSARSRKQLIEQEYKNDQEKNKLAKEKSRLLEQVQLLTKEKSRLELEIKKAIDLESQLKKSESEIKRIKNSKTYKIGRFFTYIPRKLRKKD